MRIFNPTDLDDGEFLFWGHDGGVQQATNTTDVPSGVQARFDRVWRVSESSTSSIGTVPDVGSVDMTWDLTGLGPVTASDLRLLIDTDNDGIFADETPVSGATHVSGNIYKFSKVSALSNNRRFTLATINIHQTPLPVELVSFTAKRENNSVKLNWKTASEVNNDYFTIERSKDARNWEKIGKVKGSGNSSAVINYKFYDNNPYQGVLYYRLKQTDFNGKYKYSDIQAVKFEENTTEIIIYPNPANNQITIQSNKQELGSIKIYNILGQDVTNKIKQLSQSDNKVVIDLSNLTSGLYTVKTRTIANKVYKK